jgi:hypothetical protein
LSLARCLLACFCDLKAPVLIHFASLYFNYSGFFSIEWVLW